ncbi:uncharacterized protein ACA1_363110 [Acanthamoeba castellanii str. Neff]|uniref:Uncharacterized protein n=1 Tax=Acanthamoeba castellanii (strain ATCC 30010 / Neff) TaxID=1257118 RepID=L8GGD9_ACACF|nr:uncharacterized protein ACA1_363110 [Acanthamoeba castellanii str. Neff]ELR11813.1 hypothetical protein ACA1_363110 [Acanthamoeba castellanii str. Neff]
MRPTPTIIVGRKNDHVESFLAATLVAADKDRTRFSIVLTPDLNEASALVDQLAYHATIPMYHWETTQLVVIGEHYLPSSTYQHLETRFKNVVCVCSRDNVERLAVQHRPRNTRLVPTNSVLELASLGWRKAIIDEIVGRLESLDCDFPNADMKDFYYGIVDNDHERTFHRFYAVLMGQIDIAAVKKRGRQIRDFHFPLVDARVREAKLVRIVLPGSTWRPLLPRIDDFAASRGGDKSSSCGSSGAPREDHYDHQQEEPTEILMGCCYTPGLDTVCALADKSLSGVGLVVTFWPLFNRTIVTVCCRPESRIDAYRLIRHLFDHVPGTAFRGSPYYSEANVPSLCFPWTDQYIADAGWTVASPSTT